MKLNKIQFICKMLNPIANDKIELKKQNAITKYEIQLQKNTIEKYKMRNTTFNCKRQKLIAKYEFQLQNSNANCKIENSIAKCKVNYKLVNSIAECQRKIQHAQCN